MNSSFASSYKRQTTTEITKETLNESILNHKLSLRKEKLENKIMSKRTMSLCQELNHQIYLSELNFPEEVAKDVKNYIRTKFDIKSIFNFLFSEDLLQIKRAIFLLRVYIVLQVTELPEEKRFLSRNDFALVNKLCSFLTCPDLQLQYEASWCLTNICVFPEKVEQRLFTDTNLQLISEFIFHSEKDLFVNATYLLLNISAKKKQKEYFINQNVIEHIITKAANENFTGSELIPIVRSIGSVFKIVKTNNEYRKYLISSIPNLIILFSKIKKTDSKYQIELYSNIINIIKLYIHPYSPQIFNSILIDPFPHILLSDYLSQSDFQTRSHFLSLILNFLEGSDTHVQILLDEGLIDILKQCLSEFKFSHRDLLRSVLLGISNIACGTLGQVQLLHNSNIFEDVVAIGKIMYDVITKYKNSTEEINILMECLYTIVGGIDGSSDTIVSEIFSYENNIIVDMLFFGLKEFKDMKLIKGILISIKKLIIMEENIMSDVSIKKMIKQKGIEDYLEKELTGKRFNQEQEVIAEIIIDALKDENFGLGLYNQ